MARVTADKLVPGMRLAKPVLNAQGLLLLKAGEVLTAKQIEILRTRSIGEADVAVSDAEASAPSPELLREAAAQVSHRFRRAAIDDPIMAEIARLAGERVARRLAAGRRSGGN